MTRQADKPDFAPLINQLIEKSRAGKLKWQPTANRKDFVVSVGGNTSFRLSEYEAEDEDQWGQPSIIEFAKLTLLDEEGQPLWDVYQRDVPGGLLRDLYNLARRIANNVDERVAGALSALEKL
jgi:hypothetical protein